MYERDLEADTCPECNQPCDPDDFVESAGRWVCIDCHIDQLDTLAPPEARRELDRLVKEESSDPEFDIIYVVGIVAEKFNLGSDAGLLAYYDGEI